MEPKLTIQQAAAKTDLSEHTLRYYERIGLIAPVRRAANGHRRYSEDDIEGIVFIKRLRSAGMPISVAQRFVELARQGGGTLAERLDLLQTHHDSVQQQIQELAQHLIVVEHKIRHYTQVEDPDGDTYT